MNQGARLDDIVHSLELPDDLMQRPYLRPTYDEPEFKDGIPNCSCGGLVRPDVVWFGEALDEKILRTVYTALQKAQLMLIVGTSAIVQPAASFGLVAKRTAGAFVIELNKSKTGQSSFFDLSIQGKAGELLPQLLDYLDL